MKGKEKVNLFDIVAINSSFVGSDTMNVAYRNLMVGGRRSSLNMLEKATIVCTDDSNCADGTRCTSTVGSSIKQCLNARKPRNYIP